MITGFFLRIFYVVVSFFVGLLPVIPLPAAFASAIALFWGYLNQFSYYFPMTTLVSVIGFAVAFHAILLGYDVSLKIYHLIRGS